MSGRTEGGATERNLSLAHSRCSPRHLASMPLRPPALATVGVGADEHATAAVIEHDLVEIDVFRRAQRAGLVECLHLERVVLEVEADHLRIGRHRVDALLATGAE